MSTSNYPWQNPVEETDSYKVYLDIYAVTPGHALFIPKNDHSPEQILECYDAAERYGRSLVAQGKADGFNVGRNEGAPAGQTVFWPHIHCIPR